MCFLNMYIYIERDTYVNIIKRGLLSNMTFYIRIIEVDHFSKNTPIAWASWIPGLSEKKSEKTNLSSQKGVKFWHHRFVM